MSNIPEWCACDPETEFECFGHYQERNLTVPAIHPAIY